MRDGRKIEILLILSVINRLRAKFSNTAVGLLKFQSEGQMKMSTLCK